MYDFNDLKSYIFLCENCRKLRDFVFNYINVYNELNDFIKNGTVAAGIYQNHFEQAKKAMKVMCKYLIENVIENSEIYVDLFCLLSQQNICIDLFAP